MTEVKIVLGVRSALWFGKVVSSGPCKYLRIQRGTIWQIVPTVWQTFAARRSQRNLMFNPKSKFIFNKQNLYLGRRVNPGKDWNLNQGWKRMVESVNKTSLDLIRRIDECGLNTCVNTPAISKDWQLTTTSSTRIQMSILVDQFDWQILLNCSLFGI